VTGPELCERVRELDEAGTLSRFGALVNAEEIGGAASLVAMHAPEDRYEEIAETVNEFTAVAHNYEREHPHLNMWFVVSVADHPDPDKDGSDRVDEVLAEIEAATGQETYNLPKVREFPSSRSSSSTARVPRRIDRPRIWGPRFRPAAGRRSPSTSATSSSRFRADSRSRRCRTPTWRPRSAPRSTG